MVAVMFAAEDQSAALQPRHDTRRRFHVCPLMELARPHSPSANRCDEQRAQSPPGSVEREHKRNQQKGERTECRIAVGGEEVAPEHVQRVGVMKAKGTDEPLPKPGGTLVAPGITGP